MRRLPDYPWDTLAPYRERAGQHPDGVVDLSIGTPVDPVSYTHLTLPTSELA